jgi:hypothetical protein
MDISSMGGLRQLYTWAHQGTIRPSVAERYDSFSEPC